MLEDVDQRLLIVLRDGRKLLGWLRSYDQFGNVLLSDCVERIIIDECYGDVPLGLYVLRGENVVLMGPVDNEKEPSITGRLKEVSLPEILQMQTEERKKEEERQRRIRAVQKTRGEYWEDLALDEW